MPKSKNTKPKRPRVKGKTALPKQLPPQPPESWLRRLAKSISGHPVVLLAGVFVTWLALWQWIMPAFSGPDISASGSDPSSPFVFPFSVKNESFILPMTDVRRTCHIAHMAVPGIDFTIDDFSFGPSDVDEIEANQTAYFSCSVMNPGVPVSSLSMDVTILYTTLGFWHRSTTQTFTWLVDGDESKWIKGRF